MLGRVDERSRPTTLVDEYPDSPYLAGDERVGSFESDRFSHSGNPYDYGDPTWYETSEHELAERWGTGQPAATNRPEDRYWLEDYSNEVEVGFDWREGFRPAHPTSWIARIGRLGAMLGITAMIGVSVVIFSGSQAGLSFELADTPAEEQDDSVDINTGAQAETSSWFDEIPFINISRRSADEDTDDVEAVETTTTTAWIEPDIEPEAQWVDTGNGVLVPDLLLRIRFCESTNNYVASHTVSSARGAYQFLSKSWDWYGHAARYGVPSADQATPAQQDQAALATLKEHGARPWAESRACWDNPDIDARYATAKPPASATSTTSTTVAESTTTESTEAADAEGTDTSSDGSSTDTTVSEGEETTTSDQAESSDSSDTSETTTSSDESGSDSSESTSTEEGSG